MKRILILAIMGSAMLFNAQAQTIDGPTFRKQLNTIIKDANTGFKNGVGPKVGAAYYGSQKYKTLLSIFGDVGNAYLIHNERSESKYAPSPERYYFVQEFLKDSKEEKFFLDEGIAILKEEAKKLKLKSVKVKQYKSNTDDVKEVEFRKGSTPIFGYIINRTYYATELIVFSPYRPGDYVEPARPLGTFAFVYPNSKFMSLVEVYGNAMTDVKGTANKAYAASGLSEKDFQYEWHPDATAISVDKKFSGSFRITFLKRYTIQ